MLEGWKLLTFYLNKAARPNNRKREMFNINRNKDKWVIVKGGRTYYFKLKQRTHSWVCMFAVSFLLHHFQMSSNWSIFAKYDISSRVYKVALEQAPGLCVYAGSACKPISPHSRHLSYQSVNVSPRWWTLSIQKRKFLLYCHFECSATAEVKGREPPTPVGTSLAAGWLHIFQISLCTSAGGDHDGRYKYSKGTCCIPIPLILLTLPTVGWIICHST